MPINSESLQAEESRIKEVYANWRGRENIDSRFNAGHLFMMQERERRFLGLLARQGYDKLANKRILEIGCGSGDVLRDFVRWGADPNNVTGIDLLPERVLLAAHLCPSGMEIKEGNAARLDFPNEQFDLVVQSTVFSSVLDSEIKRQIAAEMCRVVKQNGLIIWWDFHARSPKNRNVRGVKRAEIISLFPHCQIRLERVLLAPPITRVLAPQSWLLCHLLSKMPWLCTHYLGEIKLGISKMSDR
jgi:SAM-dependent methyltransferase